MTELMPFWPNQLPPVLEGMLLQCQAFETSATGSARRDAWRLTRTLIGALLADGYSALTIAHVLGVTPGSVRTRGAADTAVAYSSLAAVPGLNNAHLSSWLELFSVDRRTNADLEVDLRAFVSLFTPTVAGIDARLSPRNGPTSRYRPTDEHQPVNQGQWSNEFDHRNS